MESIQQIDSIITTKINEALNSFVQGEAGSMEAETLLQEGLNAFACQLLKEALENLDRQIREEYRNTNRFHVVRVDSKSIMTTFGQVAFTRTLFHDLKTNENRYLLDEHMGYTPHKRKTDAVDARLLANVADLSYEKSGRRINERDPLSKNTVKNLIHSLEFPDEKPSVTKRQTETLYIEADEDHCALQYKGDGGIKSEIVKMVYVHEGLAERKVKKDGKLYKRRKLKNVHYFAGLYKGTKDNQELWDEVERYIKETYDLDYVKHMYLMSDGGAWINAGKGIFENEKFILDEFHLSKYLKKMVSHLYDSADDALREVKGIIKDGTKDDFIAEITKLLEYAKTESEAARIEEAGSYIVSNWSAAKARLERKSNVLGCSAEGHVSHLLSDRLSSRPRAWSQKGLDKVARLRAYRANGFSIEELVRYQKEVLSIAAGAENVPLSTAVIQRTRTCTSKDLGHYFDYFSHNLSLDTRKKASIQHHINFG